LLSCKKARNFNAEAQRRRDAKKINVRETRFFVPKHGIISTIRGEKPGFSEKTRFLLTFPHFVEKNKARLARH
jgi:hypothetical protein